MTENNILPRYFTHTDIWMITVRGHIFTYGKHDQVQMLDTQTIISRSPQLGSNPLLIYNFNFII